MTLKRLLHLNNQICVIVLYESKLGYIAAETIRNIKFIFDQKSTGEHKIHQ